MKPQNPDSSNSHFCCSEAGSPMRSASASGMAIRPPMMVRMTDTSSALIAETATLVATAEPPKIITAPRAATKTIQLICLTYFACGFGYLLLG